MSRYGNYSSNWQINVKISQCCYIIDKSISRYRRKIVHLWHNPHFIYGCYQIDINYCQDIEMLLSNWRYYVKI